MGFRSIKKIVETEKEAENKKIEAQQKAKMILQKAEESKEINRLYFKNQLERQAKDFQKEIEEENVKKKVQIQAQTNEKLQKLQTTLQDNVPEAVEKIFNKVINI